MHTAVFEMSKCFYAAPVDNVYCTGCENVGGGRGDIRDAVAAVPVVRRVQLIRQTALRECLVPTVLSSRRLCQQRRESYPLQRHVSQVPQRFPCPAGLLLLLLP